MSSRGHCLLGRTSPLACRFAEPQWRKWLNFGRYPRLPDRQFGWASSNSLKAEIQFGLSQWLILIPKLWQMCLHPCLHTKQHRWLSYSISASNSITEQQRLGQMLVPHPHTAEWFIRWTYFHTLQLWDKACLTFEILCNKVLPFSMKSMTVKEFTLLQLLPSWLDVCRLEESSEPSVSNSELSPSFAFFDLLLFFFEDILIVKIFPTWTCKHV